MPRHLARVSLLSTFFVAAVSCDRPAAAVIATPELPVRGVELELTKGYRSPEKHSVTVLKRDEPRNAITWRRRYDGVELLDEPKSVLVGGQWELRRHRELKEPEPVRSAELIAPSAALAAASVEDPTGAKTRLVYLPEYVQQPRFPGAQNAADFEMVLTRHTLVFEVTDDARGRITWVDAYSAKPVDEVELRMPLAKTYSGILYPNVQLDVTPVGSGGDELRDPTRYSLVSYPGGPPVNGQGVVMNGTPTNGRYSYMPASATIDPVYFDAAFTLQESWDFYAKAFQRRGFRNVAPWVDATNNEGVMYFVNSGTDFNMYMDFTADRVPKGIEVNIGHQAWKSLVSLDYVGHEWTHAVLGADVPSTVSELKNKEHRGLEEGLADVFGRHIGQRGRCTLNPSQCPSPLPGIVPLPDSAQAWILKSDDTGVNLITKNLCKPSAGATPYDDYWDPINGQVSAHRASGPITRASCLLSRGMLPVGTPVPSDPNLIDTRVPRGFQGIGSEKMLRLWYRSFPDLANRPKPRALFGARESMLVTATADYGKHTAEYKAVEDAFGAVDVGPTADRDPPLVTAAWTLAHEGQLLEVTATDTNGVQSLLFTLDGPLGLGTVLGQLSAPEEQTIAPPFSFTLPVALSPGPHTVYVSARDTRKNEKLYPFLFTVDNTRPVVTITDRSGTIANAQSPLRVFDFTAEDSAGLAKARVLVNGLPSPYPVSPALLVGDLGGQAMVNEQMQWVMLQAAPAGPHVVGIEVTDKAGNTAVAWLTAWTRDESAPAACTVDVTRGTPWSSALIKATAVDLESSIATVKYKVDYATVKSETGLTTPAGTTFNKTVAWKVAAGSHTFTAQCIDHQGNSTTSAPKTMSFAEPPTCQVTATPAPVGSSLAIRVEVSAQSSIALSQVEYFVDANPVPFVAEGVSGTTYTNARNTPALSAGTHTVSARCTDSLGQKTNSNAVTLTLTTPPPPPTAAPCGAPEEQWGEHYYWFQESLVGNALSDVRFLELGRTSGQFHFQYGWNSSAMVYRLTCAGTGTINGGAAYDTGCSYFGPPSSPPGSQGDVNLTFSCNSGRIRLEATACSGGVVWQSTIYCAKP